MQHGEVWSVVLPAASSGREQAGTRPAIIIQDEQYAQSSPLVLIVPLTSQLAALRFPATVKIEPSSGNGLALVSVALVFQARAIDRARFVRKLGDLSEAALTDVLATLNKLTGQSEDG